MEIQILTSPVQEATVYFHFLDIFKMKVHIMRYVFFCSVSSGMSDKGASPNRASFVSSLLKVLIFPPNTYCQVCVGGRVGPRQDGGVVE